MAISEHDRFELHRALERAIGTEQAATLMEHLPPVGWADVATKRDLDRHATASKRDLDHLATVLRAEMAALGSELRTEMAALGSELRTEMALLGAGLRIEMNGLRAEMHETISSSIATQTRTLMFGLIGSQFTLAAIAFGAAKLGG